MKPGELDESCDLPHHYQKTSVGDPYLIVYGVGMKNNCEDVDLFVCSKNCAWYYHKGIGLKFVIKTKFCDDYKQNIIK